MRNGLLPRDRNGLLVFAIALMCLSPLPASADWIAPFLVLEGEVQCAETSNTQGVEGFDCSQDYADISVPGIAALSNGPNTDNPAPNFITGTLSGSGNFNDGSLDGIYLGFESFGQRASGTYPGNEYLNGGSVTIVNAADLVHDSAAATSLTITTAIDGSDNLAGYSGRGGGSFLLLSQGAEGIESDKTSGTGNGYTDYQGGAGGAVSFTNTGSLAVQASGLMGEIGSTGIPLALNGVGAYSRGGDGVAFKQNNDDWAGAGGPGGAVSVVNNGSIKVQGVDDFVLPVNGIFALSQGGEGSNREAWATAPGGDGGAVTVTQAGSVSVAGYTSVALQAASIGGNSDFDGGLDGQVDASGAGDGGAVTVNLSAGSSTEASNGSGGSGAYSIGVLAVSAGGNADNGWEGAGGDVTVSLSEGASVTTSNPGASLSSGVLAISAGSVGDLAPDKVQNLNTAYPGNPGAATIENAGTVSTAGSLSVGLGAMSVGGAAILTNAASSGSSILGNVTDFDLNQYAAQGASISNSGTVTTLGAAAHGLLALSVGGGGGLLNMLDQTSDAAVSLGSQSSATGGGDAAAVSVTDSGNIYTGDGVGTGDASIGIVAQSIGGGGGTSSAGVTLIGGADAPDMGGGDGGQVAVTLQDSATVLTRDDEALGILAQSVGGGGGNGANAFGFIAAVGGNGGAGGDAEDVTVKLQNDAGAVSTEGLFAAGTVAQSIGGGGGNGGYARSYGIMTSIAIGGSGGNGGDGGDVTVDNQTSLSTAGNQSWGLAAQSIGGGGGSGGAATAKSASVITVSLAMGGTGGDGGGGGTVDVTNSGSVLTGCDGTGNEEAGCGYGFAGGISLEAADAIGVLAQSIGGGGGSGGAATSKSVSLPVDDIPSVSVSFALGAAGGGGGDGGAVTATNQGTIATSGNSSMGVLAQSIGGGGGNGGDATASSFAIEGGAPSLKVAVGLGGSGGVAGFGGSVAVTNGATSDCMGCTGSITTYGSDAMGILAQSIGGGGGSGGAGSASASSPNLGMDTGSSVDVTLGVGGDAGEGSTGGAVQVSNGVGSSVVTYGTNAKAILAQSVGGGGGTAGGGSASASGDSYIGNLSIGGRGGSGNDGGTVTVANHGTIRTGINHAANDNGVGVVYGGDAVGILAQSIGGGGGNAGSSDPSANIGLVDQLEDVLNAPSKSYSANVSIGGSGGAGGEGGSISIENTGSVATLGMRAFAMAAQSIGAGGGNGGAATATSTAVLDSPKPTESYTYSAGLALGGSGGSAGSGGDISLTNSGMLLTAGYGAHGILAHAIGAGGGTGAEGTVNNATTIGLGAGISGDGGAAGDGGRVSVAESGAITTLGDDAYAVLAQSIGGGGGLAGAGCTNSSSRTLEGVSTSACFGNSNAGATGNINPYTDASDFAVTLGGSQGASGDGDSVSFAKSAGSIVTYGARAMGVVTQSIGAGGGWFAGSSENVSAVSFSSEAGSGTGSSVDLSLAQGASIVTSGAGAWGLFAQSIGGGGGFAGDSSGALSFGSINALNLTTEAGTTTDGGEITAMIGGSIATSGENAHGIVLQSDGTGGGGGGYGVDGAVFLGGNLSGTRGEATGAGGAISLSVEEGGSIIATGQGASAIVAVSSGHNAQASEINISVDGTVSGAASAILLAGGVTLPAEEQSAGNTVNTITIGDTGSVAAASLTNGYAVRVQDGITHSLNEGTLTGSVLVASAGGNLSSLGNAGLLNAGTSLAVGEVKNSGTVSMGGAGTLFTTTVTGDFFHNDGATLLMDLDQVAGAGDMLMVEGTFKALGGGISIDPITLAPGTIELVTAQALDQQASMDVVGTDVFTWQGEWGAASGGSYSYSYQAQADADFTPDGLALDANEARLASYLQTVWDGASVGEGMGALYAALYDRSEGTSYAAALDQITGEDIAVHANDQALAARSSLDASFSCPVFASDSLLLTETGCAWARIEGGIVRRGAREGSAGRRLNEVAYRMGGQVEVVPGWFAGGNVAYANVWSNAVGLDAGNQGDRVDGSLAVKRVDGPWYIGLGGNVGYGWYDNFRHTDILGTDRQIDSETRVRTVGARLRVQYELPLGSEVYVRPRLDLDALHAHIPAYSEDGPEGVAMDVDEQNEASFAVAPYVETGGKVALGDGLTLRPYAGLGLSFLTNDEWTATARLQGAPAGAGRFEIASDMPNTLGRVGLGAELYSQHGLGVRFEYDSQFGGHYQAHAGSLRFGIKF